MIGKYAGSRGMVQLTQVHYPPAGAPNGPFTFRQRVYVHDGDAEQAGVAGRQTEYAQPSRAEVTGTGRLAPRGQAPRRD